MGLRINTNVASLNAQRNLTGTKWGLDKSLERLSSGYRINRAGDDAAGLAISENLRAQTRGLKQASRNAQDGVSLIQVAEGGLNEISSIMIRLRELAVQAASDTIGPVERQFLNVEYDQLVSEVDRIADSTEFNGTQLLSGTGSVLDFQVGTRNDPNIDRLSFETGVERNDAIPRLQQVVRNRFQQRLTELRLSRFHLGLQVNHIQPIRFGDALNLIVRRPDHDGHPLQMTLNSLKIVGHIRQQDDGLGVVLQRNSPCRNEQRNDLRSEFDGLHSRGNIFSRDNTRWGAVKV